MPPKKTKQGVKRELKNLIDQFEIKFEGPVPPTKWPSKQRHLFQVIRDIWGNRYDDYKEGTNIDHKNFLKHKDWVRELRSKAYRLREDININEGTWRGVIEDFVGRRFDEEIVCNHCKNEKWKSDYEAQPFDLDEKAALEKQRRKRRQCHCLDGSSLHLDSTRDSDEENESFSFDKAIGVLVTHVPEDGLEACETPIPMHPDRIVGLHLNDRYRGYIASYPTSLTHHPLIDSKLLYPFLVIEAKKENDSPGFRSIELQTAFPIRRLLKIQDDLYKRRQISFDPLIWFFGFQGEVWRLYAGTLNQGKVQVFDLWLGTIESRDGALQLLQIVDFIWTWARDIYRPQIRRCLNNGFDVRETSPTSTNPFSRSQSVFSTTSVRSFSQNLLESVREDDVVGQEHESYDPSQLRDASSHLFLRWAGHNHSSISDLSQTCIRHSDIVKFTFRVLEIPADQESFMALMNNAGNEVYNLFKLISLLEKSHQDRHIFVMSRNQISHIDKYWTGTDMQTSYRSTITNPTELVTTIFFFRTFCEPEDWQLNREAYCVIWSSEAARLLKLNLDISLDFSFPDCLVQLVQLIRAFHHLRSLSGRYSVAFALHNMNLVLLRHPNSVIGSNQLQWFQPQDQWMSEPSVVQFFILFNYISYSGIIRCFHHRSGSLLQVDRIEQDPETIEGLLNIPENVGGGGAMLAIKPTSWPLKCPRFCLFVLLDQDFDNDSQLRRLLRYTIDQQEFYSEWKESSQEQQPLRASDGNLLLNWLDSFSIGNDRGTN